MPVSQPAVPADRQPLGGRPPWVHIEPGLSRVRPVGRVSSPEWLDPPSDQLAPPRAPWLSSRPARQEALGLWRGTLHSEKTSYISKLLNLDKQGRTTSKRAVCSLVCHRVACSHTASHCPFTVASLLSIASALDGLEACSARWDPTTLMLIATLLWLSSWDKGINVIVCRVFEIQEAGD